jgi:hypothetical protein
MGIDLHLVSQASNCITSGFPHPGLRHPDIGVWGIDQKVKNYQRETCIMHE